MQYYVIQVLTTGEDEFAKRVRMIHPELNFIIPARSLHVQRKGRRRVEISPVFPGYVFLETEFLEPGGTRYRTIRTTPGFFRFLRDNTDITPLDARDRKMLLHFAAFKGDRSISKVTFDENDRIVVLEGPLKGHEGMIIKVNRRKRRAKILLDLYGDSFTIDFGFDVVERAENEGAKTPDPDRHEGAVPFTYDSARSGAP